MKVHRSYVVSGGHNVTVRDAETPHESGLRAYDVTIRSALPRVPSGPIAGQIVVAPPDGLQQARTYWWSVVGEQERKRHTSLMKAAQHLALRHVDKSLAQWQEA